ncbi:PCI domain-containing protein 2 isoform X4 [Meles meles]|uniref:PCI domain-containing protein 2 isoform X4 n=1 Tax=Meles meles TaxID=9662 RepID=UPI001E69DE4D|nr:PCI domain-containing protein 2 isoform X4 [Meles meles]
MAHITINQYLQQVYEAIDSRDGASCAELVSFKHPHVANPRLQTASPEEKCQQVLEPPYDEMFAAHLRCTYAVGNHDFIEAYKCQTVIVQSFLRAFQAHKEENWALPVMYAVALDLRVFANNADQQLAKKGKSRVGDMLEKAAELLMSCFRVCASDTRAGIEDSKKWGMLFLVNQLFKIYFKLEPQGRLQHRAEGDVQVLRRAQGHVRQRLQARWVGGHCCRCFQDPGSRAASESTHGLLAGRKGATGGPSRCPVCAPACLSKVQEDRAGSLASQPGSPLWRQHARGGRGYRGNVLVSEQRFPETTALGVSVLTCQGERKPRWFYTFPLPSADQTL